MNCLCEMLGEVLLDFPFECLVDMYVGISVGISVGIDV